MEHFGTLKTYLKEYLASQYEYKMIKKRKKIEDSVALKLRKKSLIVPKVQSK